MRVVGAVLGVEAGVGEQKALDGTAVDEVLADNLVNIFCRGTGDAGTLTMQGFLPGWPWGVRVLCGADWFLRQYESDAT